MNQDDERVHEEEAFNRQLMRDEQEEGAWQCGNGHMFHYEPPPASPPFCSRPECKAGNFRWIVKDEVTSRDWLPANADQIIPVLTIDEMTEMLYNLSREELRRLAWEALLISDGPDSPWRNALNSPHNVSEIDSKFNVHAYSNSSEYRWDGFMLAGKSGWRT